MTHFKLLVSFLLASVPMCLSSGASLYLSSSKNVIPDEFLVVLRSGVRPEDVLAEENAIRSLPGANLLRKYTIGKRTFFKVNAHTEQITQLTKRKTVDFIESNVIMQLVDSVESRPRHVPVEGKSHGQPRHAKCQLDYSIGTDGWGLIRTSYRSKPNYETDPYIYGEGDDGTGVDIYVLDTGIRLDHEDFQGRASWGMTGDNITNTDETDVRGHGSHVAGIAAGAKFGVARKASLIACKVLNDNGFGVGSDLIQAVEFVANRTNAERQQGKVPRPIINMSLSGTGTAYATETALQAAAEEGIHSVAAAGNAGNDTCLNTPARIAAVITVSASDIDDTMPAWSNYGPCSDIIAPGVGITAPDASTTDQYYAKSGTSAAAPHVTGIVARYLSVLNDLEINTTSTDMIKASISDMGTRNQMALSAVEQLATPDRLLYKTCESPHDTLVTTSTTTSPATTTTTTHPTTTTMTTTTSGQQQTEQSPVTWSYDDVGDMSLAALVMLSINLCCCLDVVILLYCSISKM